MDKIIFVCHGSICRSPAAEFIMKSFTAKFDVSSRSVSLEEIGNDIYPPMKRELVKRGIKLDRHFASRITKKDIEEARCIFYMDSSNRYYLERLFGPLNDKIMPINIFTPEIDEIEDPWYTDNYAKVVDQITKCVKDIIKSLI